MKSVNGDTDLTITIKKDKKKHKKKHKHERREEDDEEAENGGALRVKVSFSSFVHEITKGLIFWG